jgi:hypothetical protein
MLKLLVDHSHSILLIQYSGVLTDADIRELNVAAKSFIRRHGQVPSIVDLSGVTRIEVPANVIRAMGTISPTMGSQKRIYVAPSDEAFGLVRLYATHQDMAGHPYPTVVRSFIEATALIGRGELQFVPVTDQSSV